MMCDPPDLHGADPLRRRHMPDALIIDACRTPRGIGKQGKGALAHLHPQHLGRTVLEALVERNGFDTADVDDVVWGTSSQVCEQSGDLGRMAALDAGLRRASQRHDARPLLRVGHHGEQHRGQRDHGRHGGPRHRRWHRDDVAAQEGAPADGCGQRAPAGDPPAVPPGGLRRRDRHDGGHLPRDARRARRRVPGPRRPRDRRGALRPQPHPGAEPRRHGRARPRAVPATRHHRRSRSPRCRRASPPWPTTATATTRRSAS